jgi:C4-dicarboxylate-specific signal transduction histidine kinase
MAEKREPDASLEDPPTSRPHLAAEEALPAHFEGLLIQAIEAVPSDRDQAIGQAELLALDLQAARELRKSEQALAYGQRLSNVGHLVASVNHELNQPMASIRMLAETAIELVHLGDHAAAQGNIHAMLKLSGRLTDMAAKLAAFPARSESAVSGVYLADAVDEALATLRSRLVQTPCEILRDLPALTVRAQEAQLVRVIANLVNNALDVIAHCEQRRIAFACSTADEVVTLSVSDSGPGLSEAVRERLFQPFFSTKPAGQGLGLGLALSRDVMREMGGDLTARNGSEGGAVFEIRLPLASGIAARASLT